MCNSKLEDAFLAAHLLAFYDEEADGPDPHAEQAVTLLAETLVFQQGVPAALGSGCASLKHKVHAILHSVKLCSKTFRDACRALNSTVSWVGDLGVERLITTVHLNASELMGDWVSDSDQQTFGGLEGGFDFQQ